MIRNRSLSMRCWIGLVFFHLVVVVVVVVRTTDAALLFRSPPPISEELGCSPTLTALRDIWNENADDMDDNNNNNNKKKKKKSFNTNTKTMVYFDPLNLARDDNFVRYREAELKHGRICMLAMTEYMLIPLLKRLNLPTIVPPDFPDGIVATITSPMNHYNNYYYQLQQQQQQEVGVVVQWTDYLKVIITCAVLELFVFIQRDPLAMPGDYNTGYFGIRNKGLHERELTIELEHGRLAMIATAVAIILELATGGQSWTAQWISFLKYWVQQF